MSSQSGEQDRSTAEDMCTVQIDMRLADRCESVAVLSFDLSIGSLVF